MNEPTAQARRFLVFLSDRIGDVIFCTPALRLLRESDPGAQIDVMVQSHAAAEVLRGNPCVDRVFLHTGAPEAASAARYDVLLDLKGNKVSREAARIFGLVAERRERLGDEHEAEVALACVERVAGVTRGLAPRPYELHPDAAEAARTDSLLASVGVGPDDVLVGVHMGCNRVARRGWKLWKPLTHPKAWPVASFVALERALWGASSNVRLVLTGSAGEIALGRRLLSTAPDAVNLIGRTSVLELAALMKRLRIFITADTGPLHVACAMGVPVVALFGATPVSWFGPWPRGGSHLVLHGDPVAEIPVTTVRDAVLQQLRAGGARAPQGAAEASPAGGGAGSSFGRSATRVPSGA